MDEKIEIEDLTQISDSDFITVYSEHLGKFFKCPNENSCAICNEQGRRFDELSDEEKRLDVDPMGGDTMLDYI